ncbi:unnamed protein product [Tilletia controversa]|nr:unnamed protein product [Tilletia controversa]
MQPGASGLLSIHAELRKRTSDSQRSSSSSSSSSKDEYHTRAVKGKKLSTAFIMPKQGLNLHPESSDTNTPNKRAKQQDIDKYNVRGRGPNVSLLSSAAKTPSAKLEQERLRALRAKAKAYEQMVNSTAHTHDDNDNDSSSLIDFKRKAAENALDPPPPSPSHPAPQPFFDDLDEEEEEQITYTDDFGRTRTLPRSQIPPSHLPENTTPATSISYGKQTTFPIYRPPSPKLRVSRAMRKKIESGAPPLAHFDPKAEVRNRGAGLFQFAKDEGERARQMEALQLERQRTERERKARCGSSSSSSNDRLPPREGFASAEERPWGGEHDDHEEGGLDGEGENEDVKPHQASVPLDPFAAVEMMAAKSKGSADPSSSSKGKGKKRKKGDH